MKKLLMVCMIAMSLIIASNQNAKAQDIMYPFGAASFITKTDTLVSTIEVNNSVTFVDYGVLADTIVIHCAPSMFVPAGAVLYIKTASGGTARSTNFSTGMTGVRVPGVINKTKVTSFVYDGTNFICTAVIQIN